MSSMGNCCTVVGFYFQVYMCLPCKNSSRSVTDLFFLGIVKSHNRSFMYNFCSQVSDDKVLGRFQRRQEILI